MIYNCFGQQMLSVNDHIELKAILDQISDDEQWMRTNMSAYSANVALQNPDWVKWLDQRGLLVNAKVAAALNASN